LAGLHIHSTYTHTIIRKQKTIITLVLQELERAWEWLGGDGRK